MVWFDSGNENFFLAFINSEVFIRNICQTQEFVISAQGDSETQLHTNLLGFTWCLWNERADMYKVFLRCQYFAAIRSTQPTG